MIIYSTANSHSDLEGILKLQKSNLRRSLQADEIQSQGFVTVDHTFDVLNRLNDHEKHVIAKDHDTVVGYVLAMTKHSKLEIPILFQMFDVFDAVVFNGKRVSEYNYMLVGQVCIAKEYRGQGIFDNCYEAYRKFYKEKYDFAITEIAKSNPRSLHAHKRIGFEEVHSYVGSDKTEWIIVVWDWKTG